MNPQAVTFTAREQAALLPTDPPGALKADQIRGRTLRTLVSPGTELQCHYLGEAFPTVPGYAAVFEVEEVGEAVAGIQSGDRCFCMGPHRSYQQEAASKVLPVPEGLPSARALLARLMGVSMTTLMTTSARPGDPVLVTGAGPVGFLAAHVFQAAAYPVLVVEPDPNRQKQMADSGSIAVAGHVPLQKPGFAGSVALALECSGHEAAALQACQSVRMGGEVVLVGVPWKRQTELYAHQLLDVVFHRYAVLRSGWEWALPLIDSPFHPHSIFTGLQTALRWLADGRVSVPESAFWHVSPKEARDVYQDLLNRRAEGLFTCFDWS